MKNNTFLFFLLLFSLIPLVGLLHPGLPITHDGQDHVARIANFYKNLSEGNIVPRWAGNLNWGYGHPILMFLYPLPSYLASIFHFLGFSLIDSLKLVFGLSYIASGFAMYLWIKEYLGEKAGLAAGILYTFAPYRFVDLYVRGAIGEHVAFVFPPLILYFLLKFSKESRSIYLLGISLSFASLVLSHNAISLMFLPIVFLYAFYLILRSNKDKLKLSLDYLISYAAGFGLSAFFWMPAFFEGKYTLRNIVTSNDYTSRFVNIESLIYGPWNYGGTGQFTTQVGILQLAVVILALFLTIYLFRKKDRNWIVSAALLVGFFASLFIMTSSSLPIWEKITTIQKFQFPWRFLTLSVFFTASLGGFLIGSIEKRFKLLALGVVVILALFLNKDYWHANGYLNKSDSFFNNVYNGTTDTGESAPIWSVRFMEKRPKAHIEVISGRADIRELERTSTSHKYEVTSYLPTRIRENTLYFPGWRITVNGKPVNIEFQDPANRGLMTFFVEKGKHIIEVEFGETKLRLFANTVSMLSLLGLAFYVILRKGKIWQRFL